jgi:hypothetical protein
LNRMSFLKKHKLTFNGVELKSKSELTVSLAKIEMQDSVFQGRVEGPIRLVIGTSHKILHETFDP